MLKTTYQRSLLWFLVAVLMMPLAYGQNETILVANFMNGNDSVLRSRIYLFNSSDTAGDITVRVFTLPLKTGVPKELTVGPLSLGDLGPKSALNLKLAEDILDQLPGISLPYRTDGGNLTLEFTIGAEKVRGVAQVFTDNFAFGTYPLQGPESISGTVPGGETPSGEIPDGSVTTSKIANGAVTGGKIANGAVGSAQLAEQVDFGGTGVQGFARMLNSTGTVVSEIGTDTDGGLLVVRGSTGTGGVVLTTTNGDGLLGLVDADGTPVVLLVNGVGLGGGVATLDSSEIVLTQMAPNVFGDGFIETRNTTGNVIVRISSLVGGTGTIDVRNASGTRTAGMDGLTGLVFGNVKSFIVADPSDSNRMIKYTAVEGPEAAIYVRGTANLVSGQGHIDFPDHFSVMAVPSSITVSLTPRSANSMGLAAVSVSSQGIDVAELGGGTNSYSFDYVAYAVRKGFEDYEVYLTQEQVRGLTGQAQALELRPGSLLTTSPLKAIQRQE